MRDYRYDFSEEWDGQPEFHKTLKALAEEVKVFAAAKGIESEHFIRTEEEMNRKAIYKKALKAFCAATGATVDPKDPLSAILPDGKVAHMVFRGEDTDEATALPKGAIEKPIDPESEEGKAGWKVTYETPEGEFLGFGGKPNEEKVA
jgi:hypothetical protein